MSDHPTIGATAFGAKPPGPTPEPLPEPLYPIALLRRIEALERTIAAQGARTELLRNLLSCLILELMGEKPVSLFPPHWPTEPTDA